MITFSDYIGQEEPILENLQDILSAEEFTELEESIGDGLKSLNIGSMINVFKQTANKGKHGISHSADGSKFNKYSTLVGAQSQIKDLGTIKSWKDIRKHAKREDAVGVVVYVGGKAYLTSNFQWAGGTMGLNDSIVVSVDASILPSTVKDRIANKFASQKNSSRWFTGNQTGVGTLVRDLEIYIDNVIPAITEEGLAVTAKLILQDKEAMAKRADRFQAQSQTDKLAIRADSMSTKGSLKADLIAYKSTKRDGFKSTEVDKILEFAMKNPGKEFTIDGKLLVATVTGGSSLEALFSKGTGYITFSGPRYESKSIHIKMTDLKIHG